jgi:putative peptidoglycan lipid II flippase
MIFRSCYNAVMTSTATRNIARAAVVVMVGLVLSNLVGLLRSVLVAGVFGTSIDLDSFNAANRLPDFIYSLTAGGALASAFIPTYTGFLVANKRDQAERLASAVGSWLILLLITGASLAAVFAPTLVRMVVAPGFTDPMQIQTTVSLLRILLLCPIFFGISGLVMGILNAHQRFFFSALAPMFYPLGMILGLWLLAPSIGIYGLAWGAVLGAFLHFLIQLPSLFILRPHYQPGLDRANPAVGSVMRLMAPRLLGQSAVQLNFLVNTILASALPVGSISAIGWAFSLMMMPEIAVAQAGAIAALPTLSAQASQGRIDQMRSSLVSVLRAVFFLALPASLGLILLATPIVSMIFQYGSFDAHSTEMVVWALYFYASALVAHSIVEVIVRAYYALQDTLTPAAISVGGTVLNIALSLILVRVFLASGWMPHGALALANTLATGVEMCALLYLLRRKIVRLFDREAWRSILRTVAASVALAAGLLVWRAATGSLSIWIIGPGGILTGIILYGTVSLALGSQEARSILLSLARRLRPSAPDKAASA